MVWLVIALKAALIASVLTGAGIVLARQTLRPVQTQHDPGTYAIWPWAILLLLAAPASLIVTILRLGAGFEPFIVQVVLNSPPGYQTGALVFGAILLIASRYTQPLGAVICCLAFGISGHTPSHADWLRPVIAVHVLAAAWWTGSLFWLFRSCKTDVSDDLAKLIERFSKQAAIVIGALLLAGVIAVIALITDLDAFIRSDYAKVLLAKLALVTLVLTVAVYNRVRLTPAIKARTLGAANALRRTILIEFGLIAAIVIATAVLTTSVTPFVGAGHSH